MTRGFKIVRICGAASALLLIATTARAVRLNPPPAPTLITLEKPPGIQPRLRSDDDFPAVAAALEVNPFHPLRRAGDAFQMEPGNADAAPREELLQEVPQLRLGGMAEFTGGRGFVICGTDFDQPRLVLTGGQCGSQVLREVRDGRATFSNAEGHVEVLSVAGEAGN